jgi:hypothetical protein
MDIIMMTSINKSLFEMSNPKRQKDNGKGHFSEKSVYVPFLPLRESNSVSTMSFT